MDVDKFKVLLVDDSQDDRFFERIALERTSKFVVVDEVSDGQEAIEYFQKNSDLPDIVLLDLKMPRKNGFDVLQWIQTAKLGSLTVAVLSGSFLAEDISQSMRLGAHAYFKKASSREEQEKILLEIEKLIQDRKGS